MRRPIAVLAAVAAILAAPAAAAAPAEAAGWQIEENGPAECLALVRRQHFAAIRVSLDIEETVGIQISSAELRPLAGETLAVGARSYPPASGGWDLGDGESFLAALAAAPALELRGPGGAVVDRISLSGFEDALPRLRRCVAALAAIVAAEREEAERAESVPLPEPDAANRSRAVGNLAALISDDDYPAFALRDEIEGTVGFRLRIAADGSVSGCTVTASSGSPGLDVHTCRLMRSRARFRPATDAEGRPVEDSVSSRVSWRITHD